MFHAPNVFGKIVLTVVERIIINLSLISQVHIFLQILVQFNIISWMLLFLLTKLIITKQNYLEIIKHSV